MNIVYAIIMFLIPVSALAQQNDPACPGTNPVAAGTEGLRDGQAGREPQYPDCGPYMTMFEEGLKQRVAHEINLGNNTFSTQN